MHELLAYSNVDQVVKVRDRKCKSLPRIKKCHRSKLTSVQSSLPAVDVDRSTV